MKRMFSTGKRMFSTGAVVVGVCASVLMALGPGAASAATTSPAATARPLAAGTAPTVTNCGGRKEQFEVGSGNHLYHRYQSTPGGSYSSWISLGGTIVYAQIGAVVNADCHVEAFGVGSDGAMWHIWQTNAGSGPWSNWASLGGGFAGGPSQAYIDTSSEAALVAPWYAGGTVCDNQTRPSSGPWTGWYSCIPD
jgi:hypothetical protein